MCCANPTRTFWPDKKALGALVLIIQSVLGRILRVLNRLVAGMFTCAYASVYVCPYRMVMVPPGASRCLGNLSLYLVALLPFSGIEGAGTFSLPSELLYSLFRVWWLLEREEGSSRLMMSISILCPLARWLKAPACANVSTVLSAHGYKKWRGRAIGRERMELHSLHPTAHGRCGEVVDTTRLYEFYEL